MKKVSSHNLVWIDLEMSGLDLEKNKIIEVAMVITNRELEMLHEPVSFAISHPESIVDEMDDWNKTTHKESGLLDRMAKEGISLAEAEQKCLALYDEFCKDKLCPLAGNAIHIDRMFLMKYMPTLNSRLNFLNVDVSTIRMLAKRWYKQLPYFVKEVRHTALSDVLESIEELKYYRDKIFVDPTDVVVSESGLFDMKNDQINGTEPQSFNSYGN